MAKLSSRPNHSIMKKNTVSAIIGNGKTVGTVKIDFENKPLIYEKAWVRFSARKKIQAKTVREKVSTILKESCKEGSSLPIATTSKLLRLLLVSNSGKK